MPTTESMLKGVRAMLHYTRRRFLWTWLCLAVLATLTGLALYLERPHVESTHVIVSMRSGDGAGKRTATAACPADSKLLGGGFDVAPRTPRIVVLASFPDEATRTWEVVATTDGLAAGTSWTVGSYVVCGSS